MFGGDLAGQSPGARRTDRVCLSELFAEMYQCLNDQQLVLWMVCRLHSGGRLGIAFNSRGYFG